EELEAQRRTLSQRNAELEEARLRLHEKAEELSKVSAYKSHFLANMSHELRTPLNSMLLLSHLLSQNETENLSPKQVEYAQTIHAAGKDLLALINQVLDLSKIEAGRQEVERTRVALSHFSAFAQRVFGPLAEEKGLAFFVEVGEGAPTALTTDKQRLEGILTNLVGNAIKFTDQGAVRLTIGRPAPGTKLPRADLTPETTVVFAVADTGPGIDPADHELVFVPFEQLGSRTQNRPSGTGLGLPIARESARRLGGELTLVRTTGRGTTVTCLLPANGGASESEAPPRSAPSSVKTPSSADRAELAARAPHLLVVEDDAVLAEQLAEMIRARGLEALVATTGEEGVRLAFEHRPIGIILDVTLPDIDGWAVMERLRNDPRTRTIPVHFVSGVDTPERGLSLGAVGYLTKPVTRAALLDMVRTLTASREKQRVLVVEDDAADGDALVSLLGREAFDVTLATSAKAALTLLEQQPFDCMILDLGLPDMHGLGLLEAMREKLGERAPRVVVHTGRALTKSEVKELEAYAEAVILKDGSSQERLLEEVRCFVRHVREELPVSSRAPALGTDVTLRGMKLLIADDDMRTVYALSAMLRAKGAEVLVADTGREALDVLDRNPDVHGVLMDVMMPELDGYGAMRALRADPRFTRLPVIALTAKAMKGERERCLEAGASDYLTKPVDGERLLALLDAWLRRRTSDVPN